MRIEKVTKHEKKGETLMDLASNAVVPLGLEPRTY